MAWAKNGSTTLSSVSDTITVSSLTNSKLGFILYHEIPSGSVYRESRFNGDSGNNYSYRISDNGGADGSGTSQPIMSTGVAGSSANSSFGIVYYLNVSTEEKLMMAWAVGQSTAGAGTAPNRREAVNKWVNTSDSVSSFTLTNSNTGDYDTNSNVSVLGSELTPSVIAPETNSIFVETNTASRWWYDGTYWNMSPTFEDDFSTDNWTDSDSAKIGVQSGYLYAYGQRDGTDDSSSRSLGTTLNGDFVFRTKADITSWSAGSVGYGKGVVIGLSNQDNTSNFATSQDSISIFISARQTNGDGFYADWSDNQGMGNNTVRIGSLAVSTGILYFEIIKDGTTVYYNIYSDSNYSTLVATATRTSVTATGFTHAVVRNENSTASIQSGYVEADIDDLKVFYGVTSVQQ